ncbi:MAG: hypothetical protein WCO98_11115 [bacterium]
MKFSLIFLVFIIILFAGCSKKTTSSQPANIVREAGAFSITVTKADKSEYLKISKNDKIYEIYNNGKVIGTIEDKGDKLKIYNADKTEAGKVQLDGTDLKLKDNKEARIAKIKNEDGNISIKDDTNNKLLKIKPDGNNYKIDDANGNKIGKIKHNGDKWHITDNSSDKFIISGNTSGGITGILMTDKFTLLQQAALIAGYNLLLQSGN